MQYGALIGYYLIYFVSNGFSSFLSKYYAEIGMSDSRIGALMSVPTLLALAFMPLMGALSDRVSRKRYLLAAQLILMAGCCFAFPAMKTFPGMFLAVMGYSIFSVSATPVATTISLEYCGKTGKSYGPIRLSGTIGYQLGALLVGAILSASLKSLYPMMAISMLLACAVTFFMPNVEGHQHNRRRVPFTRLFRDRRLVWLYGIIFFATVGTQFFTAFFAKYLGDLGMSNGEVSLITFLSTVPELPFLLFGDKIARKINVWNGLLLGLLFSAVRWLGLAFSRSFAPIMAVQIAAVSCMACFEFLPAFYLNRRVAPESIGAAQTMLTLTTFGMGKIVGGLLGGMVCERVGIPAVFAFNGIAALIGLGLLWRPTRRLIAEERIGEEETA